MKVKSTSLLPFLIAGLSAGPSLTAQDDGSVASGIVGYKTVTIKGDNGLTLLGIEFLETPVYSGPFSSLGTNTMTVSGEDFDALLDENASYFVDVVSGDNEGLNTSIANWSGDTLTLGDDLSAFSFSPNDTVRVHRLRTIGEIFGVGGDVLEGGTALQADLVFLPDPLTGELTRYYYSTGGLAGVGWRKLGSPDDMAETPVYFSDGMLVFKKSAGDAEIVVSGSVKVSSTQTVISDGYSAYSTVFPSGTTLGNSGLHDPDKPSQGISPGGALTADLVLFDSDDDGSLESYYFSTGGLAGVGWRRIGSPDDMSGVELDTAFTVFRRSGGAVSVERNPSF